MGAYLKNFPDNELIFDEQETRQILAFFFPDDIKDIETMVIDIKARNFAQGLLVEAVDATYAMGYVEVLCKSIVNFLMSRNLAKGPTDFLKTLGKKALSHWFKHATRTDLMHANIYDSVRSTLQGHFRNDLKLMIQGIAKNKGRSNFVGAKPHNYIKKDHEIAWV